MFTERQCIDAIGDLPFPASGLDRPDQRILQHAPQLREVPAGL